MTEREDVNLANILRQKGQDTSEYSSDCTEWKITTKYYTAEVEIKWIDYVTEFTLDEI